VSRSSRKRLAAVVRDPKADLAEAALLCATESNPDLDVDVALLRLDAFADDLRTRGFPRSDAAAQAAALSGYLHGRQGFTGDTADAHDPRNSLLDHVLARKRGLPITLSIVYVAVAHRLHASAFGIGLPGHFVTGIGDPDRPVVLDAFHGGRAVDDTELAELVERSTGGRASFRTSMLQPEPPPRVIRRLLDNLTRDQVTRGDVNGALRTIELKQLLPDPVPEDLRLYGELLIQTGRYREAATVLDEYIARAPTPEDTEAARVIARRARAKLN
jgi:regulator of sirC expression with transglutaminase-like and TPR domain